jgi:hypothetical protein
VSAHQRNKGKRGEREIASLVAECLGFDVRRRVRQHDGDSDLEGVPGWSIEVKRHKTALRAQIGAWWYQTIEQARKTHQRPVLLFRRDRDEWRAVWQLAITLQVQSASMWEGYAWTVESTVEAWCSVVREVMIAPEFDPREPPLAAGPGMLAKSPLAGAPGSGSFLEQNHG